MAASSLYRSHSALGAYFRRLKARLGAPQAITAVAHKLARLVYSLLKHGSEYVDAGQDYLDNVTLGVLAYRFSPQSGDQKEPVTSFPNVTLSSYYEQQYKARVMKNLKQRAKQLGYELVPTAPSLAVT